MRGKDYKNGLSDRVFSFLVLGAFSLATFGLNHRLSQIEKRGERVEQFIVELSKDLQEFKSIVAGSERDTHGRLSTLEANKSRGD